MAGDRMKGDERRRGAASVWDGKLVPNDFDRRRMFLWIMIEVDVDCCECEGEWMDF
jgi:hypothetical protein